MKNTLINTLVGVALASSILTAAVPSKSGQQRYSSPSSARNATRPAATAQRPAAGGSPFQSLPGANRSIATARGSQPSATRSMMPGVRPAPPTAPKSSFIGGAAPARTVPDMSGRKPSTTIPSRTGPTTTIQRPDPAAIRAASDLKRSIIAPPKTHPVKDASDLKKSIIGGVNPVKLTTPGDLIRIGKPEKGTTEPPTDSLPVTQPAPPVTITDPIHCPVPAATPVSTVVETNVNISIGGSDAAPEVEMPVPATEVVETVAVTSKEVPAGVTPRPKVIVLIHDFTDSPADHQTDRELAENDIGTLRHARTCWHQDFVANLLNTTGVVFTASGTRLDTAEWQTPSTPIGSVDDHFIVAEAGTGAPALSVMLTHRDGSLKLADQARAAIHQIFDLYQSKFAASEVQPEIVLMGQSAGSQVARFILTNPAEATDGVMLTTEERTEADFIRSRTSCVVSLATSDQGASIIDKVEQTTDVISSSGSLLNGNASVTWLCELGITGAARIATR